MNFVRAALLLLMMAAPAAFAIVCVDANKACDTTVSVEIRDADRDGLLAVRPAHGCIGATQGAEIESRSISILRPHVGGDELAQYYDHYEDRKNNSQFDGRYVHGSPQVKNTETEYSTRSLVRSKISFVSMPMVRIRGA